VPNAHTKCAVTCPAFVKCLPDYFTQLTAQL
jgi:hypothetical protein